MFWLVICIHFTFDTQITSWWLDYEMRCGQIESWAMGWCNRIELFLYLKPLRSVLIVIRSLFLKYRQIHKTYFAFD